ncbi:MAG: hypothetical protein CMG57_05395, partial [Candidatus Marinimicrobia bacterium]|nr:hypothetical protein [Candidatus Neomarinimicrobiota bacterium]
KKRTTYKVPVLSKIPWLGKKLFTSNGIVERKTDLIIQITPKIVVDAYTGITKSEDMVEFEDYVIKGPKNDKREDDDSHSQQDHDESEEDSE